MRNEIKEFAMSMEKKLVEKDERYGDSWKEMPMSELRGRLQEEYKEWTDGLIINLGTYVSDAEAEAIELIDIANVCMMMFHRLISNAHSARCGSVTSGKGDL